MEHLHNEPAIGDGAAQQPPMTEWKTYWSDTGTLTTEDVARRIIDPLSSIEAFQPDFGNLASAGLDVSRPLRILDFGAGMLRNTMGLLEMSNKWRITAYDTPDMLMRGRLFWTQRLAPHASRLEYLSSWTSVKESGRFDAVIAFLVFQHIDEPLLRRRLKDVSSITDLLCVYGRRTLDDLHTSVWTILEESFVPYSVVVQPGNTFPHSINLKEGYFDDHTLVAYTPRKDK